jgi:hypothetical protein
VRVLFAALALWAIALVPCPAWANETPRCSVCKKKIAAGKNFIRSENRVFCSDSCLRTTFESCSVCGKKSSAGYRQGKTFFCSMDCLRTTWPVCTGCGTRSAKGARVGGEEGAFYCSECAAKPRCSGCGAPGAADALPDGRLLCRTCRDSGIFEKSDARAIFDEVRSLLQDSFGLTIRHRIDMDLVDLRVLQERSPRHAQGMEMGLFQYESEIEKTVTTRVGLFGGKSNSESTRIVKDQFRILLLNGLSREKLAEVCAHELAHAWMQEHFPAIDDLKTKEGWAEYVAFLVNHHSGRESLNRRIVENKDPIYGDGFRMIKKRFDDAGFEPTRIFHELQ